MNFDFAVRDDEVSRCGAWSTAASGQNPDFVRALEAVLDADLRRILVLQLGLVQPEVRIEGTDQVYLTILWQLLNDHVEADRVHL